MIAGIIVEYQDFLALWIFEILASVDISLVIGTDKITRFGVLINTTYLKSTPYHLPAVDAAHTHTSTGEWMWAVPHEGWCARAPN